MSPSFVINLDRRPHRLAQFMGQPAAKVLNPERLQAIYWKDIDIPPRWLTLNKGPGGGYAALISHAQAVAEAKRRRYSHVVVFEDDAIVPDWFPQEMERFMDHLPNDWDLVFFGGYHERSPWPECFPQQVAGPVYRGRRTTQLECYMVNAKAYDPVLQTLDSAIRKPRGWPSGEFNQLQQELNFFVPLNLYVSQPVGWCGSDNWNHSVNKDWAKDRCLIEGWFSDREGLQYLTECMRFPGEKVVELGTWMGRSASWVAEWIDAHGGSLHCVDLWQQWDRPNGRTPWQDFEWYMWKCGLLDKIHVIKRDTAQAADQFEDGSVALVFFDADHSREALSRELDAWGPKVRAGGILCGHDYNNPAHPDVKRVVDRRFGAPDRIIDWFWAVENK